MALYADSQDTSLQNTCPLSCPFQQRHHDDYHCSSAWPTGPEFLIVFSALSGSSIHSQTGSCARAQDIFIPASNNRGVL
ncbi:hypothetical protein VTN96DRAFT_4060 [Rasamsonia emersonii]